MKYEHSRDNQYLMHHGVPGMKWGVITKEYQPVGYDHRRTSAAAQAPANAVVRKKGTKPPSQAELYYRARARRMGQQVGENFFYSTRHKYEVKKRQEQKRALEEAMPKKPDVVDRGVKKLLQQFDLDQYSEMATNFIKEQGTSAAINYVRGQAGNTIKIGKKAISGWVMQLLSQTVAPIASPVSKAAYDAAYAMTVKNAVNTGEKMIKGVGKGAASTVKGVKRGIQWLENGGYPKMKKKANAIRNGVIFMQMQAKTAVSTLAKAGAGASRLGSKGIALASGYVGKGAKYVQMGAQSLVQMLKKIQR